ncbi:MAG: ATP synthase F0 subunit B [Lachnospiraceae bacterium]|jgi:F-type H+-transporting ATPase subunit b|nr:ATP synthase F0 subunit B [Lachnospiraceae bacterium]
MLKIDAFNIIEIIVNLLVLFVAVKLLFFKPILAIIAKRQEEAEAQFAEADKKKEEAEELKSQYDTCLAGIEEEKKRQVAAVRKEAEEKGHKIISDARDEAFKVQEKIVAEANAEKDKIIKSAEKEIADMVMNATTKIVGSKAGADLDASLYDDFLGKAGEVK